MRHAVVRLRHHRSTSRCSARTPTRSSGKYLAVRAARQLPPQGRPPPRRSRWASTCRAARTSRAARLAQPCRPREGDITVFGQPPGDDVNADAGPSRRSTTSRPTSTAELALRPADAHAGLRFDAVRSSKAASAAPRAGAAPRGYARFDFPTRNRDAARRHARPALDAQPAHHRRVPRHQASRVHRGRRHLRPAARSRGPERRCSATRTSAVARAAHVGRRSTSSCTPTLTARDRSASTSSSTTWSRATTLPTPPLAQALTQDGIGRSYGGQAAAAAGAAARLLRLDHATRSSAASGAITPTAPGACSTTIRRTCSASSPATSSARLGGGRALPLHHRLAAHAGHRRLLRRARRSVPADLRRAELDPHPGLLSARRAPREDVRVPPRTKLNVFLDVQNVTNRKNPEEIIYNFNFTQARLHHRPADAGGAGREAGVLMTRSRPCASRSRLLASAAGASPTSARRRRWSTSPRILAVRGDAAPRRSPADGAVTYDALVVDADGTRRRAGRRLGAVQRAPPARREQHRQQRLPRDPDDAEPATTFDARRSRWTPAPTSARSPSKPGAAARARDPDIDRRLLPAGARHLARQRRRGSRSRWSASSARWARSPANDVAGEYAYDYRPNNNPTLASAVLDPDGAAHAAVHGRRDHGAAAGRVAAGQLVTLRGALGRRAPARLSGLRHHVAHARRPSAKRCASPGSRPRASFLHDRSGRSDTETETVHAERLDRAADARAGPSLARAPRQPRRRRLRGSPDRRSVSARPAGRGQPQALRASSRQLWYAASSPRFCAHSDSRS